MQPTKNLYNNALHPVIIIIINIFKKFKEGEHKVILPYNPRRMKANKIIFAFKPHTDIQHVIYIYTEIQLEATRIVTGLTKISSLEALYFETGWDTLTERRRHRKLTFVRQIHNKSSPQYISECLPPVSSDISGYNFRNNIYLLTGYEGIASLLSPRH